MQTMTWTSPDTGVADRRRTASLVQRNVPANNLNSLCPAAPGALPAGYGPITPSTLKPPFATCYQTGLSRFRLGVRGQLPGQHRPSSEAALQYCPGFPGYVSGALRTGFKVVI